MTAQAQSRSDELRELYPQFFYESFSHQSVGDELRLRFRFRIGGELVFEPETRIASMDRSAIDQLDKRVLDRLVFHVGLVEMLSYWKAACSPQIVIRAGSLNADQLNWWTNLLLKGMGEFFYVNRIDFRAPDFVRITVDPAAEQSEIFDGALSDRSLVMASGGKDSALTLQLMQQAGASFNCLMLNPLPAASALVAAASCLSPIIVKRTIDPRLLELNKRGFLNGHTPFSALLSFLGVTSAVIFGHSRVIVSNERSSNEGNVEFLGTRVNHQYSKTFEFEHAFREYSRKYLARGVDYFSLLRPLYEIQIIELMAAYQNLLPIFKSCNRNQLEGTWCGRCPKCISVFTLFYPFLRQDQLIETFGGDFFDGEQAIPMLRQLAGVDGHKPFECVGTHSETIAALFLAVMRFKAAKRDLPSALRFVEREILPAHPEASDLARTVPASWGREHNLPPEYEKLLRDKLTRKD
jgi:hypothetical protein